MTRALRVSILSAVVVLTACPQNPTTDGGTAGGGTAGGATGGGTAGGATGGGTAGGATGGGTAGGATGGGTGGGATGGGTAGGGMAIDAGFCGNGTREGGELCDDGNMNDTDACKNDCTLPAPAAYCGDGTMNGTEACDDGNAIPEDGCEADCTATVMATASAVCGDGARQGGEACDDGNPVAGDGCEPDCTRTTPTTITCPASAVTPTNAASCDVGPGDSNKLLIGTVLLPGKVYLGGQVLVNGSNGNITCVGCDCSASSGYATATRLVCGQNVISPGLINSHDHITFTAAPFWGGWSDAGTYADGGIPERYEHRHDWRVGGAAHNGHFSIPNGGTGGNTAIQWSELRQLMAGTTSVSGSGGVAGLLRNLDKADTSATAASQMGLGANTLGALYDTFPLKDSSGNELSEGCAYPSVPGASVVPAAAAYQPHVSEGIERSARNEFLCMSGVLDGSAGIFTPRTAMIHGIALKPADVRLVADKKSSLIWSPRSNVSLYGETAQVAVYARAGVNIAMGSDWLRSGSMNIVRELQCADYLSSNFYNRFFSPESLWRMPTWNAAKAMVVSNRTGVLSPGRTADVAVYRYYSGNPYRAVLAANPQDVLLTLRGGTAMYGDERVTALLAGNCNAVSVCGVSKQVCLAEINTTLSALQGANASAYPLFFCGGPGATEPVCTPMRSAAWLFSGANAYTGVATPPADSDGDGIADATDNCPTFFNPIRPEDFGVQADADKDGKGDVCDACPLDANATTCSARAATDWDNDGVPNASDKCPMDPDQAQLDADGDGKGDVCDPCPMQANPGAQLCPPPPGVPTTIYAIKSGAATGRVQLTNVLVTGAGANGFYVQVAPSESIYVNANNSGLFVYYPTTALPRTDVLVGDRVTIPAGTAQTFNGQIQVASVQSGSVTVVSHGNALPAAVIVTPDEVRTGGSRAAALESVLVRLDGVTVADINPPADMSDTPPIKEFTVSQAGSTGTLRVNDGLYITTPDPTVGESFGFIQGILDFRNADSKLEPRGETDMQRPVQLLALGPTGQFTRASMSAGAATVPQALKVLINSAQPTDTTVTLSSTSGLSVPASVTVLAGQVEAVVPVQGLTQSMSETVTATLGTVMKAATVRVIGATETPAVVSCSPSPLLLPEDGTANLTVSLDLPPLLSTPVSLGADAGFTQVPATVSVAPDTLSATFQVLASPSATGMGSITATLGGSMVTCPVTISNLPVTTHVVISELKVGGASAADEFVELYNPTSGPIDISGWRVQYKSDVGAAFSNNGQLPPGSIIASHGYFLFASGPVGAGGYTGTATPDAVRTSNAGAPTAFNFGGAGGHVRIGPSGIGTAPADPTAIDTVGYGATASAPEGGAAAAAPGLGSLERKANQNATAASMGLGGADEHFGNSLDTDNNGADFVVRTASQPQNKAGGTEP
ncbi:MAG: lamin tail domain-containing protein [Archangiaceae bacterium]|nr:lamin tail domain-containing protein [Archangiaceae bacterium]